MMKAVILRGGFGLFNARQAIRPSEGRRWSLKWVLAYGRTFLRTFEEVLVKKKPRAPLSFNRNPLKPGKLSSHVSRIIGNCSSQSWAAELRRVTASKIMFQSGATIPLFTLIGFTLAKEPSLLSENDRLRVACQEIREVFKAFHHRTPDVDDSPKEMSLRELQLDKILSKGCNAVVYSATWRTNPNSSEHGQSRGSSVNEEVLKGSFGVDLAVKVMFNYDAESNASAIWRAMHRESVPARLKYLPSDTRWTRSEFRLPPHPNVLEMHCAFADLFPDHPGGMEVYPDALPSRLNRHGYGRNMTLCLVMKRYDCTLKEYLKQQELSLECTSLRLFAQLMEGLVHLQRHRVSHRDLKADNLLLDLMRDDSCPHLVIGDFGCCLADTRLGFKLPLVSDDVFRGGNAALMPPEVALAVPGRFGVIDYCKSDLWVAGALAYEIYGGKNPFYANDNPFRLDSCNYDDESLPAFPSGSNPSVEKMVKDMLRSDPRKRPKVQTVATSCQLLLHAPIEWIRRKPQTQEIVRWLAEAALRSLCEPKPWVEQSLLRTFLAGVRLDDIDEALDYVHSR